MAEALAYVQPVRRRGLFVVLSALCRFYYLLYLLIFQFSYASVSQRTFHTSLFSIHLYQSKGRRCPTARKVTASLALTNGGLPPGLWLISHADWLPTDRDPLRALRFTYMRVPSPLPLPLCYATAFIFCRRCSALAISLSIGLYLPQRTRRQNIDPFTNAPLTYLSFFSLEPLVINLFAKFKVSSFNRSRDMDLVPKF